MFAMLLLSLGAAAVLVHMKAGLPSAGLAEAKTIGSVEVRLPVGWVVTYARSGSVEFITAIEPGGSGRQLSIRSTDMDETEKSDDPFLNRDLSRLTTLKREDVRMVEELKVPGGSGYIIHPNEGTPIGVIAFEDGRAVTIEITSDGESPGEDAALISEVADSIRLEELPEAPRRSGGEREI